MIQTLQYVEYRNARLRWCQFKTVTGRDMAKKLTEILTNSSKRASETEPAPIAPLALGVPQAAEASGLSPRYLWDEIKAERLKVIKKGRRVLVPVDALKKFLNFE